MASVTLYELRGADDRRFSSHSWRVRPALAHKGLDVEVVAVPFTGIPGIGDGSHPTVPVLVDGETWIHDSWAIAEYLEDTYPDAPPLFGGAQGRALTGFVRHWWQSRMHPLAMTMILKDIYDHLVPEDREYFATSRFKRFDRPIEEVQAGREERIGEFRERLEPLRRLLADQPFLGGDGPLYADYLPMGTFIWARKMSPFALVEPGDPVHAWMNRCLDLHDGMAREGAGFDW
ncbi:MAG: glutathione S-transferase family protein [Alphaproteobacteria bacterium]|nr:glutathione S-transferase family protein [Alphaproteobacteria bacterium]